MHRLSPATRLVPLIVVLIVPRPGSSSVEPVTVRDVGFRFPESVIHDEARDVYVVSNFGSLHPQMMDNQGFISRLASDGTVLDLHWIRGGEDGVTLHKPKGMAIVGDTLYVADIDRIRLFGLQAGEPRGEFDVWPDDDVQPAFPFYRGHFLNDLCAGPDGSLYFTDSGVDFTRLLTIVRTMTDAVYRLDGEGIAPIAEGPMLDLPNGCTVADGDVLVVSFGSNRIWRIGPFGGVELFAELAIARGAVAFMDGIVEAYDDLFVSSWNRFGVFAVSKSGSSVTRVGSRAFTPTDLGVDLFRRRLLIPMGFSHAIRIQPIDE